MKPVNITSCTFSKRTQVPCQCQLCHLVKWWSCCLRCTLLLPNLLFLRVMMFFSTGAVSVFCEPSYVPACYCSWQTWSNIYSLLLFHAKAHVYHLLSNVNAPKTHLLLVESLSNHCCHEHIACLLYVSVEPQYGSFKLLKPCKHSLESRHTQLHTVLCKTSREQCSWLKSQAKLYSERSNLNKCMWDSRVMIHAYLRKVVISSW